MDSGRVFLCWMPAQADAQTAPGLPSMRNMFFL